MGFVSRAYTAAGSAVQHTLSRVLGSITADAPCVVPIGGRLDFGSTASGQIQNAVNDAGSASADFSAAQNCDGSETIALKFEFANASGHATVRVWLRGADSVGGWVAHPDGTKRIDAIGVNGSPVTPSKTAYYHGEKGLAFATHGAKEFIVQVTAGSSHNRSIWYAVR